MVTVGVVQSAVARPTRSRLLIVVLLFVTVVINYLDRSNLSITAPAMRAELALDSVRMGFVLSAFGWTYALLQIPGGWIVDRVAPRKLYASLIALWSGATILLGFTYSVVPLIVVRMLVGALEAPSYPINSRVATTWFPEHERASVIGFYTSGQYVGIAFLTPALVWIQTRSSRQRAHSALFGHCCGTRSIENRVTFDRRARPRSSSFATEAVWSTSRIVRRGMRVDSRGATWPRS
jgi:sugar phosphate permease